MTREIKDSGVAWLGVIPASWNFGRVKNYYTVQKSIVGESADEYERLALTLNGVIKRSKEDSTGLQPNAFNGYQVLRQGELVFKLIDLENVSTSRVGLSPYTGIVSPAYIILKSNGTIDSKFGYYYFISLWQRKIFNHLGDDGVRSSLNANDLLNLPCLFPPPDEQNQIVDHLDSKCSEIDTVLAKTRTSIEEYKKLKQAIITQAVTKGVQGDRPMKESGIEWVPMIPADWDIIPSRRLFADSDERKRPDDELLTASQKYGVISQQQYMEREKARVVLATQGIENWKHVEPYDFIISLRSFQGGLEMSEVSGCITWHYIVLKPLRPIHSFFFKWLFKSELYIKALQRTCNFIRDGQDLRYSNFVQVPLFIPPMEEQKEIADALNIRCAEIDTLIQKKELFVAELESYKKSLIYEYVTGKKEVQQKQQVKEMAVYPFFPAVFQVTNPRFAQAILMSKVLDSCKVKMGRVKLEKMMFVLENSIGFDFDTEYVREAAGPLDKSIYECEQIISRRNKWFTIRKSQYGVSYKPTSEHSKYKKYYAQYFSDYEDAINKVISIFNDFDADQAEVIATLYGAWNDCIIDKRNYTDNDIVDEVLNHWHPKKRRFPKDMWLRAIQRMRELDLVPHGYGRHTIIKQN